MRRRIHELAAAYALDALEPRELRRFERHLARCEPCAYEVRMLGQDAVRLGRAAAFPPPPLLHARVMTAVRTTAQEAPSPVRAPQPVASATRPRVRSRAKPRIRLTAVAAAFCLAASLVLGVLYVRTSAELDRERSAAQAVNQVLAAPDAATRTDTDDQGRGITAVISDSLHRAVVTAHGLPAAPAGRVYQLWLMSGENSQTIRSVGLLPGDGGPLVATALDDRSTAFAVTVEPDGGSQRPTTNPVAQLPLAIKETGSIASTALT